MLLNRRQFALLPAAAILPAQGVSVRPITRGPRHHWFGYYDKWQFDPTDRYVLGMQVGFEHRSPGPEDSVRLGFVDLQDGDRWTDIGESKAWCWQQGCMLQWLPGSEAQVIWNDRAGREYVSHILDIRTGRKRTLGAPVYAIRPDGKQALSPDFRRLHDLRPGYGYAGIPDPNRDIAAPDNAGIWQTDLVSGKTELLIPFSEVARIPAPNLDTKNSKHWFNHLLYSPDGNRFIFLHRWQGPQHKSFLTRMFTVSRKGGDLRVVDPYGKTSHFIWRDPAHILAWAWHPSHGERFYLYQDRSEHVECIGPDVMTVNGHCTYLPDTANRWILNDTYPDRDRLQHVYLFDTEQNKRVPLGDFRSPPPYSGEWRCDTHPRHSRNGRMVVIDSAHGGNGRQMYLIDIAEAVRRSRA